MKEFTREQLEGAFARMGLTVESEGDHYLYVGPGRYSPSVNAVISLDEDRSAATIVASLPLRVPPERRPAAYELFNLVHGQNVGTVRFHLDEEGRVLGIGRFSLWEMPFNAVQLTDVVYSLLATTDRLFPCVEGICRDHKAGEDAFSLFFLRGDQ